LSVFNQNPGDNGVMVGGNDDEKFFNFVKINIKRHITPKFPSQARFSNFVQQRKVKLVTFIFQNKP
jgi:hypothetical protein